LAAPSIAAFGGNSPKGRFRDESRLLRARIALQQTPDKSEKRREQAATGRPFFWILFFGRAKKSITPVGADTHIKTNLA
jgi:hypothetical protein